jgi:hypothetical protein
MIPILPAEGSNCQPKIEREQVEEGRAAPSNPAFGGSIPSGPSPLDAAFGGFAGMCEIRFEKAVVGQSLSFTLYGVVSGKKDERDGSKPHAKIFGDSSLIVVSRLKLRAIYIFAACPFRSACNCSAFHLAFCDTFDSICFALLHALS